MGTDSRSAAWLLWGVCLVASGALCLAPSLLETMRPWLLDATGWGLGGLRQVSTVARHDLDQSEQALRIAGLEESNRRLELHAAELQERLRELRSRVAAPLAAIDTPQLVVHASHTATILGTIGQPGSSERRMVLNLGGQVGVQGDELVVNSSLPLIDQGQSTGIQADDLLLTGQTLWGRVASAGRWTSTVQTIQDPAFRAAVRLVRASPQGPVFGARGILRGDGLNCMLEQLPATEPVSIGDHVYTDSEITSPVPLYCGLVVEAELRPNDTFWTIKVLPAAQQYPRQLVILQPQINPIRMASESEPAIR